MNEAFEKWVYEYCGGDFTPSSHRKVASDAFAAGQTAERERILSDELGVYNEGRKDEREECAKIAEGYDYDGYLENIIATDMARLIRARATDKPDIMPKGLEGDFAEAVKAFKTASIEDMPSAAEALLNASRN